LNKYIEKNGEAIIASQMYYQSTYIEYLRKMMETKVWIIGSPWPRFKSLLPKSYCRKRKQCFESCHCSETNWWAFSMLPRQYTTYSSETWTWKQQKW
jgi:hypothetical protein